MDKITAHMLRHTYASMLYDAGVDIKSAQKFLGHANIEMTLSVYTHLTKHKENEAINSLNQHLGKKPQNQQNITELKNKKKKKGLER